MKATQRDFARMAQRAAETAGIAFFCGPDEAGASAAADRFRSLLAEPGERIDLTGAEVRSDPVRLADEARSTSLFGGARHIHVRASGDEAHDAVKNLIELIDAGEGAGACPVLIVASSATDKSRTAKLLAKRKDALVAMFYPPDLSDISGEIRRMADTAGVQLAADLAQRIARATGLDIRLARSEIEKLALYLDASPQSPRMADADTLDAIGAKTEEDGFAPLVNAVMAGDARSLPGELARMRDLSLNPVGVLLAFERRTAQLAQLLSRMGPDDRIDAFLESERKAHRVFWRDQRDLGKQLRRWDAGKLERLVERIAALHRALLNDNRSAELLLAQELTAITRFASSRRPSHG